MSLTAWLTNGRLFVDGRGPSDGQCTGQAGVAEAAKKSLEDAKQKCAGDHLPACGCGSSQLQWVGSCTSREFY